MWGRETRLLQGQKGKNSRCFSKQTPQLVNFGSLMLIQAVLFFAEWIEHSGGTFIHFENVFDFSCV